MVEASLSEDLMSFDKVAVWYAFMSEASSRADYQAICGERDRLYADLIEKECIRLVDESGRVGDINASAISRAICGLIDDVWQDLLFDGDSFDRETLQVNAMHFLQVYFLRRSPCRKAPLIVFGTIRSVQLHVAWLDLSE